MEPLVPLDLRGQMDLLETEACLACLGQLGLLDPEVLLGPKGREEMQDQLGKKDLLVPMDPRGHPALLVLEGRGERRVLLANRELLA